MLAARAGWHTAELQRAATERGHEATILPYEGLVASIGSQPGLRSRTTELDDADAVLARIIPSGSLEQIIFRVDALHRLEDRGIRVLNSPRAIERTVDKFDLRDPRAMRDPDASNHRVRHRGGGNRGVQNTGRCDR